MPSQLVSLEAFSLEETLRVQSWDEVAGEILLVGHEFAAKRVAVPAYNQGSRKVESSRVGPVCVEGPADVFHLVDSVGYPFPNSPTDISQAGRDRDVICHFIAVPVKLLDGDVPQLAGYIEIHS